MLINWLVRFTY